MGTLSPINQLLSPTPSKSLQLGLAKLGGRGQGIKALEGPEERTKGREADLADLFSSFKAPPIPRDRTVLCQLPVGSPGSPRENPLLRRGRRRGLRAAGPRVGRLYPNS